MCGTSFGKYTAMRQVGIQNISGTHNRHSHAKDLEQFHKNAYKATGFSEALHNSSSRLMLPVRVLFSCRILNCRQNIIDTAITVAPWMGSILVTQELVRKAGA